MQRLLEPVVPAPVCVLGVLDSELSRGMRVWDGTRRLGFLFSCKSLTLRQGGCAPGQKSVAPCSVYKIGQASSLPDCVILAT